MVATESRRRSHIRNGHPRHGRLVIVRDGAEAAVMPPDSECVWGIATAAAATLKTMEGDAFEAVIHQLGERARHGYDQGNYFYERQIANQTATTVDIDGRTFLMMSSYSYAGLIGDRRIAERVRRACEEFGTGTHGVRLLSGTTAEHVELERLIASFKSVEAAITFPSGYQANLAAISATVGRHGVVFLDRLVHASVVDACRLAGVDVARFRHNDVTDLARRLSQSANPLKLVVVDAAYSMDGDVAPLVELVDVVRTYGASLMVDEAHGLGVWASVGMGSRSISASAQTSWTSRWAPCRRPLRLAAGTLPVAPHSSMRFGTTQKQYIFSGSLATAAAAAASAAFEILESEPERIRHLHENTAFFHEELRGHGFDLGHTTTALTPVIASTEQQVFDMTRYCQDAGIFVSPIIFPAVPKSSPRLRLSVTAAHTRAELEHAAAVLAKASMAAGVI